MRKKQHKNAAHAHIGNRIIKVKDVCRIGVLGPPMVLFNSSLKRWSMFNTSTMNGVVQYFCGVPLFFCVLCTCCVDRRPLLYARVLALFCLSFLLIYTSLIFWFFAITIWVCVCVCVSLLRFFGPHLIYLHCAKFTVRLQNWIDR